MSSAASQHLVQFYEEREFLLDETTRFLAGSSPDADSILVIATETHRHGIEERLLATGYDLDRARRDGRYVSLDASATLARFLRGELPDRDLFFDVVGGVLESASEAAPSGRVHAFGEMVALLWADGLREAVVALEQLWNELARSHPLTLLCGYPISGFEGEDRRLDFARICGEHSRVSPGESYGTLTDAQERLRAVAHLQQRASSLESEIAQRQSTQRELVNREQELSDFLENAVEGIHQVGRDGRILWANRAELRMLGYRADEYVGHHISEFHDDRATIDRILCRLLRGETLYDEPARLRCKDGSIRHVVIHSNALWKDGEFVHTRCFTRDVTDRVRLEEELQQRVEELADAGRRKDEFLAMLGHELRNPLSPIVTALQVMRLRGEDPAVLERSIEVIDRQTRRMARLVDDLLDVSRITRGAIELREETLRVSTLVERAVEQARPLLEERGHRLKLDLPEEALSLRGDPTRLEQVLSNLLINAAKYTDVGGRISVAIRRERDDVVVSVRDNGIGMSAELCARAFDLFVQSPGSGVRAPGGLGVGLTLVRRLVELHGGTVEARSAGPGLGSEFIVRLPTHAPAASHTAPGAPAGSPIPSAGRRILVVDDNADAAEGLGEFLRALGHDVWTVQDGAQAVATAREHRPDVVLLDIGMPGMDGHAVARRLRADAIGRSALLVALTGYGQESDRRLSREAGFDHHLVKPVDVARLQSLLKPD
ncbi:MAG: ATP-binding protein [Acidobacteriota bacterium]